MVNLATVDAATTNTTNITCTFGLTGSPFFLQELESVLSFPARNGRSQILSIRTSDIAAAVFLIQVITFAIDHYLFKGRYLVHIGCVWKDEDHASASLDEKGYAYEKEAPNLESGQQCSSDKDSELEEPKLERETDTSATSKPRSGWFARAGFFLLIMFYVAVVPAGGKKVKGTMSETLQEIPESSSTKPEAQTGESDTSPPPTSHWGKFIHDPWSQPVLASPVLLLILLAMVFFFAVQLFFWPMLLALFIGLQYCLTLEISQGDATVPWQPVALKSTLQLAIWTIFGVILVRRRTRLQRVLWKCFKWTHAVNWWLFWGIMESHAFGSFVARQVGFHYDTEPVLKVMFFIMRPSFVAYLYSGVVCDVTVAVQLAKLFWNNELKL